jgi:hypothetical protein
MSPVAIPGVSIEQLPLITRKANRNECGLTMRIKPTPVMDAIV